MFGRKKGPIDSSALVRDGWRRTREALEHLARTPDDREAWVQVAGRWTATAVMPLALLPADGRVPMGFSVRPDGSPQEAATTERALVELTRLIDAGVDPGFLLPMRAELQFGWRRYAEADADWQAAITALGADPGTSRERWEIERRVKAAHKSAASEPKLTAKDREELTDGAAKLGAHAAIGLSFTPSVRNWTAPNVIPADLDLRLSTAARDLDALGLTHLGWHEDLTLAERFGKRAVGGVWVAGAHTAVAIGAMGENFLVELESWLTDGRHVCTSLLRGRSGFLSGPWVDLLQVDDVITVAEALPLHRARIHALMATTPELEVVPLSSIEDWTEMQEAQRQRRVTNRLAVGLSETEARGIPFGPPDFVVPLLQASARAACAAAAADAELPRAA